MHAMRHPVSARTIGRRLHDAGLHARRPLQLPLTPCQHCQRLQWCCARLSWCHSEWQRVIFNDQSQFCLGGVDQQIRCGGTVVSRIARPRLKMCGMLLDVLYQHSTPTTKSAGTVRTFKLHGMDCPLGTSTTPCRDVWHVSLANVVPRRHTERQYFCKCSLINIANIW